MEPKEENVEYHIEIQNCQEGVDPGTGEVMYVLDLGGTDIPENIAMQLAQLAADGSLNLSEGTNSIMVQNEAGDNETHVMQVEKDGGEEALMDVGALIGGHHNESSPHVIHLQMGDQPHYLADPTAPMVLPMSSDMLSFQDLMPVEKSIFGKSKPRTLNTVSLLDRGGKIERPAKASASKPKSATSILHQGSADHHQAQLGKSGKMPSSLDSAKERKGKGDKLSIYPFLKGKTPVMLTVAEDGQIMPEGGSSGETLGVKVEPVDMPSTEKTEPIILDFNTEKTKLDLLLAGAAPSKSPQKSSDSRSLLVDVEPLPHLEEFGQKSTADSVPSEEALPKANIAIESETSQMDMETQEDDIIKPQEQISLEKSVPSEEEEMQLTLPETPLQENPIQREESAEPVSQPTHSCDYENCSFQTSDPFDLGQHLEIEHQDMTPYRCFECEKRFKIRITLVIHQLVHQKDARPAKKKRGPYGARDKFYQCPLCDVQKKLKLEIFLHAKREHNLEKSDMFTCEACKFVCYSEEELRTHNETVSHAVDRRSFCDICNQTFTNIYQHKAAVHSDARPFLCNQCGYSAKTKSSLRYHTVIHLDSKDWSCDQCPYKSSSERRLKRHMKIHDPNKKHQCPKCSFATHDAYEFKRHYSKVHSRTKSYTCKFCSQTFVKHHEIRLHLMFEHECNDAFFCNFCDFTCATRADYKEHIQEHNGRNKHVCEICGFTGRYRTHYRRHMLTHTSDKPFTCKICFKSVREASNLRRHMLTHSEDKPLACSVCGYRCKIRSRLMNHMKTHSELRPFACHLCKYTTKFNGNLMKHLENHARYKPHKCQFCSYACNERNKLRRHMNFRHKGLTEAKKEVLEVEEGGAEEAGKEIVILPSSHGQEQFLVVQKDDLGKIVSVDETGAVIDTDGSTIVVSADAHQELTSGDGSQGHLLISGGDRDGVVSDLKDRGVLAALEMEGGSMESLAAIKNALGEA